MTRYPRKNVAAWAKVGTHLAQVDSTSAELWRRVNAAAAAGTPLPQGLSLRADFQTAGRGRFGRAWEAAPGENLAVSFLLRPTFLSPARLFALSQNTALAVRAVVERLTDRQDCRAKWPNDILVDGRKVAGILIENSLYAKRVATTVVGIGINVNQVTFAQAPDAISLRSLTGRPLAVGAVFAALAAELQARHERLAERAQPEGYAGLQQEYEAHLFGLGEWLRFRDLPADRTFVAQLKTVGVDGRIVLERDGSSRAYSMDEVRYEGPILPIGG